MSETKMIDAMANTLVGIIPDAMGPFLPVVVAFLSAPFTFFMSNNAFYFGVMPIIVTSAAESYGISAAEIGRAAILGTTCSLDKSLGSSSSLINWNEK